MNILYGFTVLFIGSVAVYLISALLGSTEFGIAFAVIFLAAVIAARSPKTDEKE
jgi:hypothetical protein